MLVAGRESLRLLETARPALDVLVVLGFVQRLQDAIPGGARVGIVGIPFDDEAEAFHRLVVIAVVEEELTVLVDDGDDLFVVGEQGGVKVGRLAEQAIALGDLALAAARRASGLAHFLEGAHRLQQRVLVVLADRLGAAHGQVLASGILVLSELEVEDVGAEITKLGGIGRVGEVGQIELVRLRRPRVAILVDDLRRLLVLLRFAVHRLGDIADEPLGQRAGVLDRLGSILVGGRPRTARAVGSRQLAHLLDGAFHVAHQLERFDDPRVIIGRLTVLGIQVDEQAIGLDRSVVARLIEHRVGELPQDLARVLFAADRGQKLESVVRALGVVLGEQLDQVVERLPLQLLGPLLVRLASPRLLLREVEHVLEPQRALVGVAELPVAPGRLEQRQVVKLALRMGDHLLVGVERRAIVLLLVKPVLADGHPGVGHVTRARVLVEDGLEVLHRLARLPLIAQRERIQIGDGVDLPKPRIPLDEIEINRLRLRQIHRRRPPRHLRTLRMVRMAGRNRRLIPPHLLQIDRLRLLPVELGELVHRLRLLPGMRTVF